MSWSLRIAGALALMVGVLLIAVGGFTYFGLRGVADADVLFDAFDAIAVGTLGALLGGGLIVHATRAPKSGA